MLQYIRSVLGLSHLGRMFKGSWKHIKELRDARRQYIKAVDEEPIILGSNDSSATMRMTEEYANVRIKSSSSDPDTAKKLWILQQYASLVLTLKRHEEEILNVTEGRMRSIASTAIVLCAVGFIPSCIASLGNLFDDASLSVYYEDDQRIVGALLIVLGTWCSISILQTILFHRIVPSIMKRKVLGRLVKRHKKKSTPPTIFQKSLLKKIHENAEIDAQTLEACWSEAKKSSLIDNAPRFTLFMMFFHMIYPLNDLINWLTYPIMLILQLLILAFLWSLPKNEEEYDTSMKGQNIFSIWIFLLNFLLSLSSTPPISIYDNYEDSQEED